MTVLPPDARDNGNCGICENCLDKVSFGGTGRKRKPAAAFQPPVVPGVALLGGPPPCQHL